VSGFSSPRATALRYVGAFVIYLLAAGIWYHALLLHPNSHLPCCISDGTGTVRDFVIASAEHRNALDFTHDAFNGAPEGSVRAPAAIIANAGLQTFFVSALRGPLGLVASWNLFALIGLVGSAMAVFWLLQRLGCTTLASLFGGYVVGFCPDAIARVAAGHLGFIQNWVFVLVVLAAIALRSRRTYSSAALVGLTVALGFYISAYQGLLAALIAIVFLLVELPRLPSRPDRSRSLALLSFMLISVVVALLPLAAFYERHRSAVQDAAGHGGADLLYFGARAGAYLLPSPNNPLFHWVRGIHPAGVEQVLFIGFVTMALAVLAYILLFKRDNWLRRSGERWWAAISFAVLIPVAVIASLPPAYHVGSSSFFPTPSILLAGLTTYWRVYSRFGMVADFAVAILASLALSALAERRGWPGRIIPPVALVVVVLELLPGNIAAFSTTAQPGWVAWLSNAPHGTVATYPLDSQPVTLEQYYYQALDRDPGFAIANQNLDALQSRTQAIRYLALDLGSPLTAGVLSAEKVRYVVVHDDVFRANHEKPPTLDRRFYTLRARFGETRIYAVHARPVNLDRALAAHEVFIARQQGLKPPSVQLQSGFGPPQHAASTNGRRLDGRAVIAVHNSGDAMQVRLSGRTVNRGKAVVLRLLNHKGMTIARVTVPAGAATMRSVPLPLSGQSHTTLTIVRPSGSGDLYLSGLKLDPVPIYVGRRSSS
jgi:hypothetical protein